MSQSFFIHSVTVSLYHNEQFFGKHFITFLESFPRALFVLRILTVALCDYLIRHLTCGWKNDDQNTTRSEFENFLNSSAFSARLVQ